MSGRRTAARLPMAPDATLALLGLALLLIGLVAISSASIEYAHWHYQNAWYHTQRHLLYLLIAVATGVAVYRVPSQFWLDELEANSVSCGPINTLDQVFHNEHVMARDMRIEMDHAAIDAKVPLIRSPIRMSKTPTEERYAPPALGEHTEDVLGELLGMDSAGVRALKDEGIV